MTRIELIKTDIAFGNEMQGTRMTRIGQIKTDIDCGKEIQGTLMTRIKQIKTPARLVIQVGIAAPA